MNTKSMLALFALTAFGFASCSEDDNLIDDTTIETPSENVEVSEIKCLGDFDFDTVLGNAAGASAESRTPSDVDEQHRPGSKYYLNNIHMLSLVPTSQPKEEDKFKNTNIKYNPKKSDIQKHEFVDGKYYRLYYQLNITKKHAKKNWSNSGQILLSTSPDLSNPMTFELSVFDLDDLHNTTTDQIPLNGFSYEAQKKGVTVRGTTLRYSSFNPKEISDRDETPHEGKVGRFASLPTMPSDYDDILKGDYDVTKNLVYECEDKYFSGNSFLLAADNDSVYLLEVIPAETEHGGYFLRRTYPAPSGDANPSMLALNRLSTVINLSFMINDDSEETSRYFVKGNESQTIKNFKSQYGVDLSTLECPYAAVDGVNTRYYINEEDNEDKTTDLGRLVLWAKGHSVTGINGVPFTPEGVRSMNVFYDHGQEGSAKAQNIKRGYGIMGNSYAVAFPGNLKDTQNQSVTFWVTVEGVNVKIVIPMTDGIEFSKNYSQHIIAFVPAQEFADAVKKAHEGQLTRGFNPNNFVELTLSSDCLAVQK